MENDAFEVFVTELLTRARVITPNIPEAEKLAGLNIHDEGAMREAAARIRELGARAVLIKGGHRYRTASGSERVKATTHEQREAVDLLDDEGDVTIFRGDWIDGPKVRGTGCMLSAAIASGLARGFSLPDSIKEAKAFVTKTFRVF